MTAEIKEPCCLPDDALTVTVLQCGDEIGLVKDLMQLVLDYCVLQLKQLVSNNQDGIVLTSADMRTPPNELRASSIHLMFICEKYLALGRYHLSCMLNHYPLNFHFTVSNKYSYSSTVTTENNIISDGATWHFDHYPGLQRHNYVYKPLAIFGEWDFSCKKISKINIEMPHWLFVTIASFESKKI